PTFLEKVIIAPPEGSAHGKGLVQGLKAGGFIFFSAIHGNDPVTGKESDDTKEQARVAFENLKILLTGAAATLGHGVKVTLYLHDLKYRLPFHDVWMEYFPKDAPARVAIQVADANAQPPRNAHFAIDVIALEPQS
ncbi:MAG: RidA family protein, partial [Chloroflexota bacterium]